MAVKKGGLGRGFDSLFNDNVPDAEDGSVVMLPVGDIEPDRTQPRRKFDRESLLELADSIKIHGIIQPLLVRPRSDGSYIIVAGERRWRAAKEAGISEVPAQVRALSDSEAAEISLIENLQREDLDPVEEAEGIRNLIEKYEYTQEEAAQRIGKSRAAVTNTLRLLGLPAEALEMLRDGRISAGHARALLGLSDPDLIVPAAQRVVNEGLSVRATEKLVRDVQKKKPEGKKKGTSPRAVYYDEAEIALSEHFGREIRIRVAPKGGSIEIPFFDRDDLEQILRMID